MSDSGEEDDVEVQALAQMCNGWLVWDRKILMLVMKI